ADRVAQEVARRYLEPRLEPVFHADSYGYRPGKSAIDAVRQARQRCWRYDWVLDLDVKAYFDSIDWKLLLKAVCHHTDCPWVLLTKIVYCKDANRRDDFPNQMFDFLGFTFRARKAIWHGRLYAHSFRPAASPTALKAISRTIRRWTLHHRSDKSLQDLAEMYNPCIRGWINYYSHFTREQLRPTLKRIDAYVIRWARRKFKSVAPPNQGCARVVRAASPQQPNSLRTPAAILW